MHPICLLLDIVHVCIASVDRMERFNELVPRSRTLQQFVLRPHNVRVALDKADESGDRPHSTGHGSPPGIDGAHAGVEGMTSKTTDNPATNSVCPQGDASSFPEQRKPNRRRARGNGKRRNLSPLKGGKASRKPLSKLRGPNFGNSIVSVTL